MRCEHALCFFLFLPTKTIHMSYASHFSVFIPSVICIFVLINSNIIVVPVMIYNISTQIIYNMSHRKKNLAILNICTRRTLVYGNLWNLLKTRGKQWDLPKFAIPLSRLSYCSSLISSLAIPKLHIDFCYICIYIYIQSYA